MSVTQTTSIQEVLSRVFRNTRVNDPSYLKDAEEWIPEAMGIMRTKISLVPTWKDIYIKFHKGRMPCGMSTISAVQYHGCRLRYSDNPIRPGTTQCANDGVVPSIHPGIPLEGTSIFGSHIVKRPSNDDGVDVLYYETDLAKIDHLPFHDTEYYFTELDYFNTSFATGKIRVHFRTLPVDDIGLPLIPDDELYKTALYWYVRGMMIGAGFQDKVFNYQYCNQQFNEYAAMAMARITYPTVDETDAKAQRVGRMIFPENWYDSIELLTF